MKEYDVIVIGSGSGLSIVSKALKRNLTVALVAEKYLGGTCLNAGCVPSKTLVYPADRLVEMGEARKLGIEAAVTSIDFSAIMARMRRIVARGVDFNRDWVLHTEHLDFYEEKASFIDGSTMRLDSGAEIRGRQIFIASGARPAIPPIDGLEGTGYLTNETLLALDRLPESMIVIGGGYIAVEYAHFFAAMGTEVTVVEAGDRLVSGEEPEVSALLRERLAARMSVHTGTEALAAAPGKKGCTIRVRSADGTERELTGEKVLVAAGRVSNAPSLKPEAAGVELDEASFIRVNDYLETTAPHIWAVGDATGRQMFTHAADRETEVAWHNAVAAHTGEARVKMAFSLVPHAIFTSPQIASIGMRESDARAHYDILTGRAQYSDTVQGEARMESAGFAKAIVEKKTGRILGFHIIGPQAPELIQEVVNAMTHGRTVEEITESIHIFPAMSELIPEVFDNLK